MKCYYFYRSNRVHARTITLVLVAISFVPTIVHAQTTASQTRQLAEVEKLGGKFIELYRSQQYEAAIEPAKKMLEVRRSILGLEHADTAYSLNNLAFVYKGLGDYANAESLFQQTLAIRKKILPPEHPDTADALNNLATIYELRGNFSAAGPLYIKALKMREKILGPNDSFTGISLNNLAVFYYNQGRYAEALPLYRRALQTHERVNGPEHPETASTLNNLASLYVYQGNYDDALPLYKRSLQIREKTLGPDHPDVANSLNNLADLYYKQSDNETAKSLYERSLKINETSLGSEHPQTAASLDNLASLYERQGDYDSALPLYQRAIKIRKKAFGTNHPDTATSLNNLAVVLHSQGNYGDAFPLYKQAQDTTEKMLGFEHPTNIKQLNSLGIIHEAMGRTGKSVNEFDQARRATRSHVTRVLPALTEQQQTLFLNRHYVFDLHRALSIAFTHSQDVNVVRKSAAWLINGKAVAQESLASRNLLSRDAKNPKLAPIVKKLLQARTQLASLAMSSASPDTVVGRRQRIAQLTADEQDLSQRLGLINSNNERENTNWVELETVQAALSPDTALVDIARFDVYDFTVQDKSMFWKPARYAAWITSGVEGQTPVFVDLGHAETIDRLIEAVRQIVQASVTANNADAQNEATARTGPILKELAAKLWRPLEPHLKDTKEIVLSPDAALWLAPMGSTSR